LPIVESKRIQAANNRITMLFSPASVLNLSAYPLARGNLETLHDGRVVQALVQIEVNVPEVAVKRHMDQPTLARIEMEDQISDICGAVCRWEELELGPELT
jgi:hypothetical protein